MRARVRISPPAKAEGWKRAHNAQGQRIAYMRSPNHRRTCGRALSGLRAGTHPPAAAALGSCVVPGLIDAKYARYIRGVYQRDNLSAGLRSARLLNPAHTADRT